MIVPRREDINCSTGTSRYMSKNFPEFYDYLMCYDGPSSFAERLYWYYNGISAVPRCKVCGEAVSFISLAKGYRTYCSARCMSKDTRDRVRETCHERYGCDAPAQNSDVISKVSATKESRYGSAGYNNREKARETCRERYGVDNAAKSARIKERAVISQQRTLMDRYGVTNVSQLPDVRDKIKSTNRDRYDSENLFESDIIKQRIKNTCQERYGVDNAASSLEVRHKLSDINSSDDVQQRTRETCRDRYGVDYVFQSPEIHQKMIESCINRYGVDNAAKSQEIKQHTRESNREHYGVDYPSQLDCVKQKIVETKRKNETFNTSRIEERTAAWLDSNNIKYIRQYKSDLYPYCCDFYLPDHDLYIEIQGSWTHGSHPYNADSEEDTNQLLQWSAKKNKYYDNAIETWTHRDVAKRECAIRNKLNYIEIFSNDEEEVFTILSEKLDIES